MCRSVTLASKFPLKNGFNSTHEHQKSNRIYTKSKKLFNLLKVKNSLRRTVQNFVLNTVHMIFFFNLNDKNASFAYPDYHTYYRVTSCYGLTTHSFNFSNVHPC